MRALIGCILIVGSALGASAAEPAPVASPNDTTIGVRFRGLGDHGPRSAPRVRIARKPSPWRGFQGEGFPEMRKEWDTPLPAPAEARERRAHRGGVPARGDSTRARRTRRSTARRRFVDGWLAHADPGHGPDPAQSGREPRFLERARRRRRQLSVHGAHGGDDRPAAVRGPDAGHAAHRDAADLPRGPAAGRLLVQQERLAAREARTSTRSSSTAPNT